MFNFTGTHIVKCPTGVYTLVGAIPYDLCLWRKATREDIMGGRATRASNGTIIAPVTPIFGTREAAQQYIDDYLEAQP